MPPHPSESQAPVCRPFALAGGDEPPHGRRRQRQALSTADALLLTGVRIRVHGPDRWALVEEGFRQTLGEDAAMYALHGIRCLLEILDGAARRPFILNPPGHPEITPSELTLASLLAALQRGRRAHAEAILRWLLPPAARTEAAKHAFWIAEGLKGRNLMLSLPAVDTG